MWDFHCRPPLPPSSSRSPRAFPIPRDVALFVQNTVRALTFSQSPNVLPEPGLSGFFGVLSGWSPFLGGGREAGGQAHPASIVRLREIVLSGAVSRGGARADRGGMATEMRECRKYEEGMGAGKVARACTLHVRKGGRLRRCECLLERHPSQAWQAWGRCALDRCLICKARG